MSRKFSGYDTAARIDKILNSTLEKVRPDSCSADELREWINLTRTVRTSLDLIDNQLNQRLEGRKS